MTVATHLPSYSYVWMWKLNHKEGWAPKNWYFWIMVLEKTLESPLDCKESKPVSPKGNQPWIVIGRTDAEAEAPILWLSDAKSWFIGKERLWCWERLKAKDKGAAEDKMVRSHHWLSGHESEWTLEDNEGQGSLVCGSPWGRRVGHDLAAK